VLRDLEAGKKRAKIVVDLVEAAEEELEAFQVELDAGKVAYHSTSFQVIAWSSLH